jgi:hypothetical protein
MAISEHVSSVEAVSPSKTAASLSSSIKNLAWRVKMWANTCADYYAAAAMYEHLNGLSNAELHRRGLSRDTLAQDVCQSSDRTADR